MSTMTIHPAAPLSRSAVRLTRRGRLVMLLVALGLVLAFGFVLASGSFASRDAGTPEPTRVVMVGPGDTLWDIAADLAGAGGVRSVMAEIERLNALESGMVVVGQELRVPLE
ncbi:MAG: LysM peptidoglycan-binding domain-containing protein [Nocardioides sp.]|nr:LysM peptidoglycan-binding domain-containing protein [Nocardioides sp.]